MALDYKVTEVPEGLESYYKETDTGFVLDVEGVIDSEEFNALKTEAEDHKKKVKEFRDRNIALQKQVEKNTTQSTSSDDQTPPNIDELINDAVREMKAEMDQIRTESSQYKSQLEEVVLSDRVKDIAIRHGVYETALPDVVTRARSVFTVKDGKPVPVDKKARDENGELYTPDTWLKKLQEDAPHLFKSSSGSGAQSPVNGSTRNAPRSSVEKITAGLDIGNKPAKNVM